jgi:hypothetical protein
MNSVNWQYTDTLQSFHVGTFGGESAFKHLCGGKTTAGGILRLFCNVRHETAVCVVRCSSCITIGIYSYSGIVMLAPGSQEFCSFLPIHSPGNPKHQTWSEVLLIRDPSLKFSLRDHTETSGISRQHFLRYSKDTLILSQHNTTRRYMRSDVLTAVKMSMTFLVVVTPCGLIGRYQRFGENTEDVGSMFLRNAGTHLQDHTASQPRTPPWKLDVTRQIVANPKCSAGMWTLYKQQRTLCKKTYLRICARKWLGGEFRRHSQRSKIKF